MTVRECIELLQKEDPDRLVICQKDAEGNSYSPLSAFATGAYKAETTWWGEAGIEELTPEDIKAGYTEEDVMRDGVPALFLIPVN
jgi:hypothetical protein